MYKFLLCIRYMTSRYIGLVSVISVMLGVATMIVVNSVMLGFGEKMRDRLHGILADVVVGSTSLDGFGDPNGVMEKIREVAGDQIADMTQAIEIYAVLSYQNQGRGPHYPVPITLVGVDAKERARVGDFAKHLVSEENQHDPSFALRGDAMRWRMANLDRDDLAAETPPGAFIGYQIANYRGMGMLADQRIIQLGQKVNITTLKAGQPKPVDFAVVVADYYKSDMSEYDGHFVFVPKTVLQQYRAMGDAVTSIQIKLKPHANADRVVAAISAVLPPTQFSVRTWEKMQGPLLQAVDIEAFILNVILFLIIAVAGFGILAIFFMIVVEKTRDIGTLKALGASNGGVMGVFLGYGLVLGLVGCGLGMVIGIAFTLNINQIEHAVAAVTGREIFPQDIYYFKEIPVVLRPFTVFWINLGALAIAVGASVLPARRAAQLQPVEALRYE